MRIARSLIAVATTALVVASLGACASASPGGADAIVRLESAHRASPTSASVNRALGIAYYEAGRYAEARPVLERAVRADPRDGTAALYLGMTAERQDDLPAAHAAYASYIRYGRTSRVRRDLEKRLAALQARELAQSAKAAVNQERQLSAAPGSPNTVAVLPLNFAGADTSLRPLERGFTELLTTDLSRSSRLTVVERARLQALIDELKLQHSGLTDSSTNVRAGRIIQAGRVVQGAIEQQGEQIRVDAAVVDVPTTQVAGSAVDSRALDQIFQLEKNIAFQLFQSLHITLTPAEQVAIDQRPTRNLQAFLAYSRGLQAEDQGQYDEASRLYQQAIRIDPGFAMAAQRQQQAQNAVAGQQISTSTVESSLKGTAEGQVASNAALGLTSVAVNNTATSTADVLNPPVAGVAAGGTTTTISTPPSKDPAAAGTGAENPASQTAKVTIIVKYPGPRP